MCPYCNKTIVRVGTPWHCGDGCCSDTNYENQEFDQSDLIGHYPDLCIDRNWNSDHYMNSNVIGHYSYKCANCEKDFNFYEWRKNLVKNNTNIELYVALSLPQNVWNRIVIFLKEDEELSKTYASEILESAITTAIEENND